MNEQERRNSGAPEDLTGDINRLDEATEFTRIDQAFVESHLEELLWLFSLIKATGQHYTADMLVGQERFGSKVDDMWDYSEARVDSKTGEIVNVLLAGTMVAGRTFHEFVYKDSGQEVGDRRLYISELVTRPGQKTRSKGYASTALDRSMQTAHAHGIDVVTLVTDLSEDNKQTLDFYGKRGFRPYWFQDYAPPLPAGGQSVALYKLTDSR